MKNLIVIILSLFVGLTSCEKVVTIDSKIKNDPKLAEELRATPTNITIGNNSLILTTYLWRDFMPIAEENGSKMICVNKLTEINNSPILNTITFKRQYVINGNEIWIEDYSEIRKDVDHILEGIVRNGPKWGPNIKVDVVCEFENLGKIYRIIAKSQLINRTD